MTHEYTTKGTCARKILFDVDNGKVHNVQFINGCSGNTHGWDLRPSCCRRKICGG